VASPPQGCELRGALSASFESLLSPPGSGISIAGASEPSPNKTTPINIMRMSSQNEAFRMRHSSSASFSSAPDTSTRIDLRPAGDPGEHAQSDHSRCRLGRSARAAVDRQLTYRRLRYSKAEAFPSSRVRCSKASNREARRLSSTKYYGPREKIWLHWEWFDAHSAWMRGEAGDAVLRRARRRLVILGAFWLQPTQRVRGRAYRP
jgi:hypothetical protein